MEFVNIVENEDKLRWMEVWSKDIKKLPEEFSERRRRRLLARKNELERELWAINMELNMGKYPQE